MTSQLTQEMERLFALSKILCEGNELEVIESHEIDNTSVMFVNYLLHEYMITVEGSGKDMVLCVRSISIPELYLRLPPPAYVRIGNLIALEDLC